MARGYEFYVRVARTTSQMLFVLREQKIRVFELKCIILFIVWAIDIYMVGA